ncbi:hypothetical protein J3459_016358 [Metarhizium acridum]|nr:hypothetical protein J3459_016358 [Metarhizium acridum]
MEASDTTASSPYDTPNSIFSTSSSTGSSSAISSDTFFSMLDGSGEDEENTAQALIDIINGILGPIRESGRIMSDESWASGADDNDPEPHPPLSPPKTPPPFWPRPSPHNRNEQDQIDVWDMIIDEEEVREAEWESL